MQKFASLLFALILVSLAQSSVKGLTPLPASLWYAVAWVRDTDTLHWINAQGEQGQMPRPVWTDEAVNSEPSLEISPNGRMLIQIIKQASGFEAIGFYDLQTGQFTATHQAQAGERFIPSGHQPFARNSTRYTVGLTTPDANAWRILNFDLPSGNVVSQLTSVELNTGLPGNQYYPYVTTYGVDEGLGQSIIHFQMHTQLSIMQYAMYYWYPETTPGPMLPQVAGISTIYNTLPMNTFLMHPHKGFDFAPITGFPVLAHGDGQSSHFIEANVSGVLKSLVTEPANVTVDRVRWLNGDRWVAYRRSDGVMATHWRVLDAGSAGPQVPLGPNFSEVFSTPDGYLAQDGMQARLMHVTQLEQEAFAAEIGTTVFQPFSYYRMIYVTPTGTNFMLTGLPTEANPAIVVGGGEVQAPPQTCGTAPAPRLTVGENARVTFTNGVPLNVRTAAAGDLITQIAEGTTVQIVGGPSCVNNYLWWQLQFESGGATVGGWAAEGDNNAYYLEPAPVVQVNPGIIPATPLVIAPIPVSPTSTPLAIAPIPLAPTSTPDFVIQAQCSQSPAPQLSVGGYARTRPNADGTLAVYSTPSTEIPHAQIPANTGMQVIGGPTCRSNGQRMWQVQLNLNGQSVTGWAAEGIGQTYFLLPGLPRAN